MAILRRLIRTPLVAALLGSLLVFLGIMGLRLSGSLEYLELASYDWFLRIQPEVSAADPRITIIEISESDILTFGRWPLTDATFAEAMRMILKHKPRAIGFDIFRDIPVPPGNEELTSVLVGNPEIIGVMKFGDGGVPPPPVLKDTDQVGFNDILVDSGGVVRRGLLFLDDGEKVCYSLALRLALLYLQAEGIVPQPDPENSQYVRLKNTTIRPLEANDGGYIRADARGYQLLLDFKGAGTPFRSVPFLKVMSGEVDPEAITARIVLIGVTTQSVKDFFYTPLSRGLGESQQVAGIVLHAQIVDQLLRFALDGTSPIASATEGQEVLWVLIWSIMGGAIGLKARSAWRFAVVGSGGLLTVSLLAYLALLSRWWIPLVPPALSFLVSAAVVTAYMASHQRRERALLMHLFSRHVSREIAETIWQQRDQFLNGGRPRSQKAIVTVLFSDLRGFTAVAEKMDPQDLIDWLNTYMEAMAQIIMEHGGVIDEFTGDGIKADFGVPFPRGSEADIRQDAVNAVTCALTMEKEMHRLNALWREKGLTSVGMRVGIFTGEAVAGALGSSKRMKYTTVGDTVNIASRLESYDKESARDAPCRILIGESTLRYVGARFRTERVGEVSLKGKDERITVYRVLGIETERGDSRDEEVIP